jgi:putative copper export protein
MPDWIGVPLRWLHIASMAALLGGMIFWRVAVTHAADTRGPLAEKLAAAFRPLVFASIGGLVISGTINLLSAPGHSRLYHIMFGIKLLLALHVFAAAIVMVRPDHPRRNRNAAGIVVSGLVILLISAWLRRNF